MSLQLPGAQHFAQLVAHGALFRLQQAGHLHGNGAGPGGAAPAKEVAPRRLHDR